MDIIGNESTPQTSCYNVRGYHERDEETCGVNVHSRESGYDLRAAEDEACADQEVGCEAVEEVGQVSEFAVFGEEDFGKGVGSWGGGFDLDGDEGEEEDLEGAHCAVPVKN